MGYDKTFKGSISVEPPLNASEISFLQDLSENMRINRVRGPLYVGGETTSDGEPARDIHDSGKPYPDQPDIWMQWVATDDGAGIEWDGNEKFHYPMEWMQYLIDNLFSSSARKYVARHHTGDERLNDFTFDHSFNGSILVYEDGSEIEWDGDVSIADPEENPTPPWKLVVSGPHSLCFAEYK